MTSDFHYAVENKLDSRDFKDLIAYMDMSDGKFNWKTWTNFSI